MIKNKKLLYGILVIVVLTIVGISFYILDRFKIMQPGSALIAPFCRQFEKKINNLIEEANYCNSDQDCIVVGFGCPFGCGSYVNRNSDLTPIRKQIDSYHERCGECMYMCVRPFNPVCQKNRCVETTAICHPDKIYKDAWDCKCSEGTASFTWLSEETKQTARVCRTILPCKGESPYERQSLSYDYIVYSYDNYVQVSGSLSELPDQPAQEKTINLYAGRDLYLPTKEGQTTIRLEKIKDNIAHFLFTYMTTPLSCESPGACYSCSFTSNQTPIKGFSEARLDVEAVYSKASIIIDNQGNISYEAEGGIPPKIEKQKDSSKISKNQYNELVRLILDNDFFSFNDSYVQPNLMDATRYIITVERGDQIKSVSCYGSCPGRVVEIREKIKELWGKDILEVGM